MTCVMARAECDLAEGYVECVNLDLICAFRYMWI